MLLTSEVILFIVGCFIGLIGMIYKIYASKIDNINIDFNVKLTKIETDFDTKITKIENDAKTNHLQLEAKQQQEIKDIYAEIKRIQEGIHLTEKELTMKIHDLELTVAEFGSVYVTRNEINSALVHQEQNVTKTGVFKNKDIK